MATSKAGRAFLIWGEVVEASGMLYILIYMLFVVDLYLKLKLIEVRMPWLLHGCSNLLCYNRFFEILIVD